MSKLKCYYAHTMISYGSTIEAQDVTVLKFLGFEVINPNSPEIKKGLNEYLQVRSKTMDYFCDIIHDCDLVVFRALPDGTILSGIAAEVQYASDQNIPIIEIPCSLKKRMQEYPETKQYLTELGFYKVKND